jgi:hypothetical protein
VRQVATSSVSRGVVGEVAEHRRRRDDSLALGQYLLLRTDERVVLALLLPAHDRNALPVQLAQFEIGLAVEARVVGASSGCCSARRVAASG